VIKQAQTVMDEVGMTLNMNSIADDTRRPLDPSGIRFGTPAMTTRGMKEAEATRIAELMIKALKNIDNDEVKAEIREEVKELCLKFPIPEKMV